jgi:pyrroline-5-carboxylate reductase
MQLAAQTVRGAATMCIESGLHPGALKDQVCSAGGTTIAAVQTLENHGFRAATMAAVVSAAARSVELREESKSES